MQQTLQASIYIPPTRKRTLFKYRDHFWKGGFPYPAKPMFVKGILIFVLYWKRPYLTYLWNRIGFIYAAVGQRCLCRHSKRFVTPKNYPRAWKSFSMDQKRGRALKNMLPYPFWETLRRDTPDSKTSQVCSVWTWSPSGLGNQTSFVRQSGQHKICPKLGQPWASQ